MARRYALVIGIQDYQSIAQLTKTRGDARSMADFLRQTGEFQDVFAVRPDATRADLVAALKQFQARARGNDALVYFTGHGFGLVDEMTDGVTGYLAAADTQVSIRGDRVIEQQNGIALASLGTLLEQGNFSSLVLLLDACHSGLLLERGEIERGLSGFTGKRDYFLITACRGFEQAAALEDQPHSLFTGAVLGGLAQENADEQGKVSVDRLFDVVARTLRDSGQEPLRMGMGSGITVVQYRPSKPVVRTIDETNPYQGLQAFTKETKRFFFGRDRVVDDLVLKLQASNFVPLIGPSGSGKSSVVRAGLIPRLEDLGWHVLEPMKPDVDPICELKRSLGSVFDRRQLTSIHQRLDDEGLRGILELLPNRKHLLVVDQFEEVFTLSGDRAKQRRFIEMLVGLEMGNRLSVVTTMRSDFVETWQAHGDLVGVLQGHTVWMPPLEGTDLRDVIVKPAEVQGYRLEPGLEALILEDVATEENGLPLLEFALEKLWEQREQQKLQMTVQAYQGMGRLMGLLDRYATDWYGSLTDEQQESVRRVMLELVRVGVGTKDTRWRRQRSDVLALGNVGDVIDSLVEKRLLASAGEEIDLAHERLMDGWQLFRDWREDYRDLRRLVQRVKDAEQEWKAEDKNDEHLMQGGFLTQVHKNRNELVHIWSSELQDFYEKSYVLSLQKNSAVAGMEHVKKTLEALVIDLNRIDANQPLAQRVSNFLENDISEYEIRMFHSHRAKDWMENMQKNIILALSEFIQNQGDEFFLPCSGSNIFDEFIRDFEDYLEWIKRCLLSGDNTGEDPKNSCPYISPSLYVSALDLLDSQFIVQSPEYLRDEINCHTSCLRNYFIYAGENFQ
jgi:uncharacterized caspase-like protein